MKGFLFNIGDSDVHTIMERGVFGVRLPARGNALYSTLSDYTTIKPGDKVFFFQGRLIFGIGEVANPHAGRGAYLNYKNSVQHRLAPGLSLSDGTVPDPTTAIIGPGEDAEWATISVVVPFCASPFLFAPGIDMDEVLGTPGFDYAWGLKFNWQRSFVQLGVDETSTLVEIFLRRFYSIAIGQIGSGIVVGPDRSAFDTLFNPIVNVPFSMTSMVSSNTAIFVNAATQTIEQESVLHGLVIEAFDPGSGFVEPLGRTSTGLQRLDIFHELAASPGKPPKYIDRMDVVATASLPTIPSVPVLHEIIEIKKDKLPWRNETVDGHLAQVMKYVDFLSRNYTGGNYDAITATLIASDFDPQFKIRGPKLGRRTFVLDPHEAQPSHEWKLLRFLRYSWNPLVNRIQFTLWP